MPESFLKKSWIKDVFAIIKKQLESPAYILPKDKTENNIDARLVVYTDPKSYIAEEYRAVRTNLRCISPEKPLHAVAITSAFRNEGKTITAANLSLALSLHQEEKTVLVDADLRKPGIHKLFNIQRKPGLTEVLSGSCTLESLIDKPAFENLYILPAGSEVNQPTELLSGANMAKLVQELRNKFTYVIFDVAPINLITDAGVIGNLSDGSLIVVKAGASKEKEVEEAYRLLKEARANPVGTILTNIITYAPKYFYKYKYV